MKNVVALIASLLAGSSAFGGMIQLSFPIDTFQATPAPAIPMGDPLPSGIGLIMVDTIANSISWQIDYQDLTGDIVSPGAHLHGPAGFGSTAGLQIDLAGNAAGTGTGAPLPQPPMGSLMGSATLTDMQEADLLAGLWYVNIHTGANPAGEIRGQVIPEPTIIGMIAIGGMVVLRRRPRRLMGEDSTCA